MKERSAEEIAMAQLDYDAAEAKQGLIRALASMSVNPKRAREVVDAIEAFFGKLVMRWWFARIKKNRETPQRLTGQQLLDRRSARVGALAITQKLIESRCGPVTRDELQIQLLDAQANCRALWQALIDAAILQPDTKQEYLDAGVKELYAQADEQSKRIAPLGVTTGAQRAS